MVEKNKLKLIVEVWDGNHYVYREDKKQFKIAEVDRRSRKAKRVDPTHLDNECDLSTTIKTINNWYMVFNLANKKRKKLR